MANGDDGPTNEPEAGSPVARAKEILAVAGDRLPPDVSHRLRAIIAGARVGRRDLRVITNLEFVAGIQVEPIRRVPGPFLRRLSNIGKDAIAEAANTVFFVVVLAGTRWLVVHVFGDSQLFDRFPLRYLFDAADVAVIARFIWNTMRREE